MKLFLAVLVLAVSGVSTIAGCAASTADGTKSPPDPKSCEAQTSADGVTASPAGCDAEPSAAPAPAPPAVVEKVGVLVVANDLGPDNVQR
jgi:hypothetical protein